MKLGNYPTYDYNPFRIDDRFIRIIPNSKEVVVSEHGEVLGKDNKYSLADFQEHIRVFNYDLFLKMSASAIMIMSYIMKEIPKEGDEVLLNIQSIMEIFNLKSRTAVYTGIINLVDSKVIAKKVGKDLYYINPDYLFKGSRSKWYDKTSDFDRTNNQPKIKTYVSDRD
jgi:hypothetical protein